MVGKNSGCPGTWVVRIEDTVLSKYPFLCHGSPSTLTCANFVHIVNMPASVQVLHKKVKFSDGKERGQSRSSAAMGPDFPEVYDLTER
ncbi:MAG TPA: hypothetical protein VER36_03750 [Flavisolibacter sp.]|nr:hypothetical protein [Flavisolibacter sp.]